ncbi:phosphatase [Shewanella colwelliana]|uniref:HAD family hydrolase n=1 Tax=Shewanella colwelliana TaxID=23 RepID=A0A1E5IQ07_SHECO|nr:HAD-IA family hydrolase [Shewanella colwelliana]OEG72128.1 hypothetical protein BEL05_03805 [Shewanella colwelliana]GIU27320.1 phosphatase [Shewanella colwelliana]
MQHMKQMFEGFIFDLDGTLVSSSLDFTALKASINCPLDEDILAFMEQLSGPQRHQAEQIIVAAELDDAQQCTTLHGTLALLDFLLLQQVPMAIVTRNSQLAAQCKIEQTQLPIELVLTRGDGPAKPNPSSLTHISHTWGIAPDKLAYIGDHLYDVQAANRAGMQSVLLTFGQKKPYEAQAAYCFTDPMHMLKSMPLLPLCA